MRPVKTAFLSDIHGNLQALEAVLKVLDRMEIRRIVCLGDIVGYGAEPEACVRLIQKRCIQAVQGNHEAAILSSHIPSHYRAEVRDSLSQHRGLLTESSLRYLASLPLCLEHPFFTASHGSPRRPRSFEYVTEKESAQRYLAEPEVLPVSFCGHTHRAAVWMMEGDWVEPLPPSDFRIRPYARYLVDVGSVGQPRDRDPRACAVIYDPAGRTVEFLRVEYDIAQAARTILDRGGQPSFAERLHEGI